MELIAEDEDMLKWKKALAKDKERREKEEKERREKEEKERKEREKKEKKKAKEKEKDRLTREKEKEKKKDKKWCTPSSFKHTILERNLIMYNSQCIISV